MYYLGVDGGGTKTKYILINEKFETLADIETETIHIHQVGIDGLKRNIKNSIKQLCTDVKINISDINYIFLAVPGYGESKDDKEKIDAAIAEILSGIDYTIDNDAVAGWAAGTECREGINIVAGTGSIAFGKNSFGEVSRVGGWGPIIGDDGGAHYIGIKVINEYTKQKDSRKPKTILVDILESEKGITDYYGIVDLVFNEYKLSRTEIAKFSEVAAKAAMEGCEVCREIFKDAAKELFMHIKVLADKLGLEKGFIVSYTGGVFKAGELILKPMEGLISDNNLNCVLQQPKLEPWQGAALMAYILHGNSLPEKVEFK